MQKPPPHGRPRTLPDAATDGKRATPANPPRHANDFDEYMRADFAPADGFDFPFGRRGGRRMTYRPSSDGKDAAWVREHYAEPSVSIRAHRTVFVPQNERALVLVNQQSYKMRLYLDGRVEGEYDVSFRQGEGEKRVEGDNKTPKGMYFVTDKRRGEFPGDYGANISPKIDKTSVWVCLSILPSLLIKRVLSTVRIWSSTTCPRFL